MTALTDELERRSRHPVQHLDLPSKWLSDMSAIAVSRKATHRLRPICYFLKEGVPNLNKARFTKLDARHVLS